MKLSELNNSFLFKGIDEETVGRLISSCPPTVKAFKRGETIYSSRSEEKLVGFILSGKCEVRLDRSDGSRTLLNTLEPNGSFGILSIYSNDEYPTQIYAAKNSEICFFNREQIEYFVNNYSQISANLIKFLSERISFLNKKITTFSGTRVEDRLCAYLLLECQKYSSDTFPFNRQKTAEEINAGRASVYRAISALEESGIIKLVDKKIILLEKESLERK